MEGANWIGRSGFPHNTPGFGVGLIFDAAYCKHGVFVREKCDLIEAANVDSLDKVVFAFYDAPTQALALVSLSDK